MISDAMDRFAENLIRRRRTAAENDLPQRGNIVIAVKTWSEVLEDNKARLQFFQERLNHQVDDEKSLKFLKEKYERFLEGVVEEEAPSSS